MKNSVRFLLVFTVLAVFTMALAQNVTGAWKGKVSVDFSKFPAPKDDNGKKMIAQAKDMISKMSITLNLNANKTYEVVAAGLPGAEKTQTSEGTWKQSGTSLTLTATKENGKKPTGNNAKPQTLTVSADGKKMTMKFPGGESMGGAIIFTR
jgi:hypothetical protein